MIVLCQFYVAVFFNDEEGTTEWTNLNSIIILYYYLPNLFFIQ